jgi:hypothetical protein
VTFVYREGEEMYPLIVDIKRLSDILHVSPFTLRKVWKGLPHFFVGEGRNLKSARFDVNDVLNHLKGKGNVGLENKKRLVGKILASEQAVQEARASLKSSRNSLGSGEKERTAPRKCPPEDPFDLLRDCK